MEYHDGQFVVFSEVYLKRNLLPLCVGFMSRMKFLSHNYNGTYAINNVVQMALLLEILLTSSNDAGGNFSHPQVKTWP